MNNPFLNKSISHATLRTQDLLESFGEALVHLAQINKTSGKRLANRAKKLADIINAGDWEFSESVRKEAEEEGFYMVNEDLFNRLNDFAPEGFYFGTHPGDGSDFGFWTDTEWNEEFDGAPTGQDPDGTTDLGLLPWQK